MKASRVAIIAISLIAGLGWGFERNLAAQLRVQLEIRQQQARELDRLRQEHARLLRLLPSDTELDRLHREAIARAQPVGPAGVAPDLMRALQPGVWAPAAEWKNCGRTTPESALETMLWATAGGDLTALKGTLEFDDASRAKGAAILAGLPESSRRQYATPEDLLAVTLAGNIPLESAQFVARQRISDDEVTAYVRLKDPSGVTRQVHLTLRRSPEGWKLHVPAAAVNEIAQGP